MGAQCVYNTYFIQYMGLPEHANITRSKRGKEEHQDGVYRENRDWLECWASTYCSLTTETCRTLQQSFLPFFFLSFSSSFLSSSFLPQRKTKAAHGSAVSKCREICGK